MISAEGTIRLRSLVLVHGALTVIAGALLLFVPGRTLTFVAVLAGIGLCLLGAVEIVDALRVHEGSAHVARIGVGLVALVCGVIVIVRPEGSVRAVALASGFYLLVVGVTRVALGMAQPGRVRSGVLGGLTAAAGVALMVWPDVTIGVVAAIVGIFLVVTGGLEVIVAWRAG